MSTSQRRQFQDIFANVSTATAALTPAAVGATTTNTASTITVPGAQVGDLVFIILDNAELGDSIVVQGEVLAVGVVTVKFSNCSAGSLTPPAANYTAICLTPDPKMFL